MPEPKKEETQPKKREESPIKTAIRENMKKVLGDARDEPDEKDEEEKVVDLSPKEPDKEEKTEEPKEDPTLKIREEYEAKIKDLSARLTREQQEKAELYRFHRETIPKLNKKFEEEWEESPEGAVKSRVKEQVAPVANELTKLKAQQALLNVQLRHKDDIDELLPKMAQISFKDEKHAALSWDEDGLESLYMMAKADKLEGEAKKLRANADGEREKGRAFSEEGSSRPAPKKSVRLTAAELRVARNLGISPEDYAAQRAKNG